MKTLQQHIHEWKVNNTSVSNVNTKDFFLYDVIINTNIRIFNSTWRQVYYYNPKVFINGKRIEIDENGYTLNKFKNGTYAVNIEGIDQISKCEGMFSGCTFLKKVPLFDTRNANDMSYMFWGCENLKIVPKFNTINVKSTRNMFYGCGNLIIAPFFNTKNVIDISGMFRQCENLERVPEFDTKNVNTMECMFANCINLKDVPRFFVGKFCNIINMFYGCKNLSEKTKEAWSDIYDFETNNKKL